MILVTDPRTLHVLQGRIRASEGPDDVLVARPGTGIAACLRDPDQRFGAMAHFLHPGPAPAEGPGLLHGGLLHGGPAMAELVACLLRRGAARRRLEVWLFGGADHPEDPEVCGAANAVFAREAALAHGLALRGEDLGGAAGRRIRFHPHSGHVEVTELALGPALSHDPAAGLPRARRPGRPPRP